MQRWLVFQATSFIIHLPSLPRKKLRTNSPTFVGLYFSLYLLDVGPQQRKKCFRSNENYPNVRGSDGYMLPPTRQNISSGFSFLCRNITSPIVSLRTVEDNRVICVRFRDPKYPQDFVFPSTRLEGARDPPKVLKPGEYNGTESQRGRGGYRGGGGRGGDYRPNMGFGPRQDQASLGQAGHRMISHHVPPPTMGGAYSSVPPPLMMGQPEGGYPSQRGRGSGFSRGDGRGRGGGGGRGWLGSSAAGSSARSVARHQQSARDDG